MHTDPMMQSIVLTIFFILVSGLFFKIFKQPSVVGYIAAGVFAGPFGLSVLTDVSLISRLGGLGVVLLMFFVGVEICLNCIVEKWKIIMIGTILQIFGSILVSWVIGIFFDWHLNRVILIGFVISLSSTAVVLKLLKDLNELSSEVGQSVTGILLVQDVAVILMIVVLQLMVSPDISVFSLSKQITGFLIFCSIVLILNHKDEKKGLSIKLKLFDDPEYQVFISLLACFGGAVIFSFLELSTALGAFGAGLLVAAMKKNQWVHHNLSPFRVVFISLFFVSVGMQIDIPFITQNYLEVLLIVGGVIFTNTLINTVVLRFLGMGWKKSFYSGALLSQIGEFSFVLAALGYNAGIITKYGFNLVMSTIAVSLVLSIIWIKIVSRFTREGITAL